MYLVPYIACGAIYGAVLVFMLRVRSANGLKTSMGVTARGFISFLLLCFVGVLWYYSGEKFLESKKIELWTRIVSSVFYLALLPEVWAETCPDSQVTEEAEVTETAEEE